MKKFTWQILLGLSLVLFSVILYFIHFLIFKDARYIFIYFLGDLAFLPIEVLLVTLIIDRVLNLREKRTLLGKLNMVIGSFFSEVGMELISYFISFDSNSGKIKKKLAGISHWNTKEFLIKSNEVKSYDCNINSNKEELKDLKAFLSHKRAFLLRLLENPNLLEHESFTALLWAVFHLMEELDFRTDLKNLPVNDYNHISGDMKRAYLLTIVEWIAYVKHLKNSYPYLFSLASRVNPFNEESSPIVK